MYSIDLRQPVLVYDLLLAVVLRNMRSQRTGTENRRFFSDCFMKTPSIQFLKVFEVNGTYQRFFDSELFFQRTRTGGYLILEYLKIQNRRFFKSLRNCTAYCKQPFKIYLSQNVFRGANFSLLWKFGIFILQFQSFCLKIANYFENLFNFLVSNSIIEFEIFEFFWPHLNSFGVWIYDFWNCITFCAIYLS